MPPGRAGPGGQRRAAAGRGGAGRSGGTGAAGTAGQAARLPGWQLYPPGEGRGVLTCTCGVPARAGKGRRVRPCRPILLRSPEQLLLCFSLCLFTNLLQVTYLRLIQQQETLNPRGTSHLLAFSPRRLLMAEEPPGRALPRGLHSGAAQGAAPAARLQLSQCFGKAGAGHCPRTARSESREEQAHGLRLSLPSALQMYLLQLLHCASTVHLHVILLS